MPVTTADVLLMDAKLAGKTIGEISKEDWTRGLYLRRLTRGRSRKLLRGRRRVEARRYAAHRRARPRRQKAAGRIGAIVAPSSTVDFVVLGLAIFLGGYGWRTFDLPGCGGAISLGTSIGALLAGLLVGHLRVQHPLFGRIPDGAVAFMTSLGLAAFVGLTGISAGPIFLSALREAGLGLLLGGAAVTLFPR